MTSPIVSELIETPQKPERQFLPQELDIDQWDDIRPYFEDLESRQLVSSEALRKWLQDLSEVEAVLEEDLAWRYILMTIDTRDENLSNRYQNFVANIQPHIAPYSDKLNKKLVECDYSKELEGKAYEIYLRKINSEIGIFREKNVPLISELQTESQEFGTISGGMSVDVDGKKLTMQAAAAELRSTDRSYREKVWRAMHEEREDKRESLDELFSSLVKKRHQVALNADFANFRDYKFEALGRFDYTPEDCFAFHESIASEVSPLIKGLKDKRRKQLGVDSLRPWDLAVDPLSRAPLQPFKTIPELVDNSVSAFDRVNPFFGDCLATMNKMGHLDLDSKEGKSPGGYNYPLYELGVPFIFMNAVGTPRDLVTMMHEGGHAIHSFLTRDLELTSFQSCPSEVAELASMSMELISMDHWDLFYQDEDLIRAKQEHLEDLLAVLPWIGIIDKFQHWIYENPDHTVEERTAKWIEIHNYFTPEVVDYSGIEGALESMWQKQLHLFEVPFYYIEYGMAQLGAIAVWRNYKRDPQKAIADYRAALSLGYTKSIGDIYETAGIRFDFSREYVAELITFVKEELAKLSN